MSAGLSVSRYLFELADPARYSFAVGDDPMPFPGDDPLLMARQRIALAPYPAWADAPNTTHDQVGKVGEPLSYLLVNRQVHAELAQTLHHTIVRLQTVESVQHLSQWRLPFEPRTQSVFLHWIRIRRGGVEINHADLARVRLLQREEGLEGQVLDGWCTLLLVLEDVRPGDLLDTCYTVESRPRLLPEACFAMFSPPAASVARFDYTVRFNEARPLRWKSSLEQLAPTERREGGDVVWHWEHENQPAPRAEANTPGWHLASPWIQVSDAPDWGHVAAAVAAAWTEDAADTALDEIVAGIAAEHPEPAARVARALAIVQDEHRYLSVNAELGGQIPTPPGTVTRRRYGDCKDLSFLLVNLLRRLGVAARPVLVHSNLGRHLPDWLPSLALFNHVVVEFELAGQTRWVDATIKRQGGGPLERFIPNFHHGLPVDPAATGLIEPPAASLSPGTYEVRETLLLDTTGAASLLAVTVLAQGAHAEMLRHRWENLGTEEFGKERLHQLLNRFGEVRRVTEPLYRDQRDRNEFALAEVFEVGNFLGGLARPGFCRFAFPNSVVASTLPLPPKEERRAPWALPYPCHVDYTVEIESPVFQPMGNPRTSAAGAFFEFQRREKSMHHYLSVNFRLNVLTDSVPAAQLDEFRKQVEGVWKGAFFELEIPLGYPRPRAGRGFGQLPEPPLPTSFPLARPGTGATLAPVNPDQAVFIAPTLPSDSTRAARPPEPDSPRRRRRGRAKTQKTNLVILLVVAAVVVAFFAFVLLMASLRP